MSLLPISKCGPYIPSASLLYRASRLLDVPPAHQPLDPQGGLSSPAVPRLGQDPRARYLLRLSRAVQAMTARLYMHTLLCISIYMIYITILY